MYIYILCHIHSLINCIKLVYCDYVYSTQTVTVLALNSYNNMHYHPKLNTYNTCGREMHILRYTVREKYRISRNHESQFTEIRHSMIYSRRA